ncbi:MAG: substrate-binding and VWA domain-containing protein [Candidatus Dormibacteraceae bacterium]
MFGGAGAGAGCAVLVVLPADDVSALAPIAAAYETARAGHAADCPVRLLAKPPGEVAAALARGWKPELDGPAPTVWLPGSSAWLAIERDQAPTGQTEVLGAGNPSFAQSPLVLAMPLPMAQALGWPQSEIGFSDLAGIGVDPAGWGRAGHPEWGPLRLGKTNPTLATSGLNALIATYFAATGVSGDLTVADIAEPAATQFARGVELATVHYGVSSEAFLEGLRRADAAGSALDYISAVAVEERQVLNYNDPGRGKARPNVPLAAIYPREGTLTSDNPFATLHAGWVSDRQRSAAAGFLDFLRSPDGQSRLQVAGYRGVNGRLGAGRDASLGVLPDHPQKLIYLPPAKVMSALLGAWGTIRKPVRVLVVVDVSGSMSDWVGDTRLSKLDLVKAALGAAIDQVGDDDEVGLWTFSDTHREVIAIRRLGDQRPQLKAAVAGMEARGGTLLYTTAQDALDKVRSETDPGHISALVLLTDGEDNASRAHSLDALVAAETSQPPANAVRVFTIAYGTDANRSVLARMATPSGGSSYDASNPTVIRQVFNAILSSF